MARQAPYHSTVRALEAMAARMIKGVEDNNTARRMQAEINRLHQSAAALNTVAVNRSPLDTPEAHAMKVGKMSKKFDQEVTAVINRAGQICRAGLMDAERRIEEKTNLKPDAFAQEIRASFRTMDSAARHKLIKQLVDEKRGPELAALVKAPTTLTGLQEGERAAYEKAFMARYAGEDLEEIQKLEDVFGTVIAATDSAGKFAQSLTDPRQLARIEREAAEAAAAGAAFDQLLEPPAAE